MPVKGKKHLQKGAHWIIIGILNFKKNYPSFIGVKLKNPQWNPYMYIYKDICSGSTLPETI